jgi:CRP/FNR family transcriptional regulator, cyclic AMP receptor protein
MSASPEDLAGLLAKVEVFGVLPEKEILWLARRVPELRLERGRILYGPTQESRIFFAVLEGRVRLYKMLGGAELTLEIVEAGNLFGDAAALAGRQRGAYAEALDPSRVAFLNISLLHHLVQENPEVGLRLAERLARRLYESREWIADIALKRVSARLASFLIRLLETEGMVDREGVGIRTRYTHEQFASMIGARRVAVSRAMGELRSLGAVQVKGRRVYLRDEVALRRAAKITAPEV